MSGDALKRGPLYNIFMPKQQHSHFQTYLAKGVWKPIHNLWIQGGFIQYAYRFTDKQADGCAVFDGIDIRINRFKHWCCTRDQLHEKVERIGDGHTADTFSKPILNKYSEVHLFCKFCLMQITEHEQGIRRATELHPTRSEKLGSDIHLFILSATQSTVAQLL